MLFKLFFLCVVLVSGLFNITPEIRFEPIALSNNNTVLFNSIENIAGVQYNKTLFLGKKEGETVGFEALSFYPEYYFYDAETKIIYIQNRIGLYEYDTTAKSIKTVPHYPSFTQHDEYIIYHLPKASFSPNFNYLLYKINTSAIKASIYLYDRKKGTQTEIIKDVEINPGQPVCYWNYDSNLFLYKKNGQLFYFSVNDYKNNKLLAEDWRFIGKGNLNSALWTKEGFLIWLEGRLIYKADTRQFFSRSIYRKYIRQGTVIGKIPFEFDPEFDSFHYNETGYKFVIVKNNSSVFYYSLLDDLKQNIYLELKENMYFDDCYLLDNNESIFIIRYLGDGKINKKIILLKKQENQYRFTNFEPDELKGKDIYDIALNNSRKQFVVTTNTGAYNYDFASLNLNWKYELEKIKQVINTENDIWLLGGEYSQIFFNPKNNTIEPILASSFTSAGFIQNKIGITCSGKNYLIDENKKTLIPFTESGFTLSQQISTNEYRLMVRTIKKGFYQEGIFLKEQYSGKQFEFAGEPNFRYTLSPSEPVEINKALYPPPTETPDIALVFNCIKSAEGIFPILSVLSQYNITATFFICGTFMEINPVLIKEMVKFKMEFGNLFQYYVNLTDSDFLIDKNFIRQGLSVNEEKYYNLTGKNFSPIWHSPMYAYNESIIKYGNESGYKFITFHQDSMDWVGEKNFSRNHDLYLSSPLLVEKLLKNIKSGQIIIFSTGKNDTIRSDWLFNNLDLLIGELIRSGYSFISVSDFVKKYPQ